MRAGERKQVTVLFADLKGSMELIADRDPEDARRLLDPVDPIKSEHAISRHLESRGISVVGARSVAEITHQLLEQLADETEPPLELSAEGTEPLPAA